MARRSTGANAAGAATVPSSEIAEVASPAEKPIRPDTAALDIKTLATIILAREVRPRVGDIRRLAEAVLRKKQKKKAKKARKGAAKGERKLSKIPARKGKK